MFCSCPNCTTKFVTWDSFESLEKSLMNRVEELKSYVAGHIDSKHQPIPFAFQPEREKKHEHFWKCDCGIAQFTKPTPAPKCERSLHNPMYCTTHNSQCFAPPQPTPEKCECACHRMKSPYTGCDCNCWSEPKPAGGEDENRRV